MWHRLILDARPGVGRITVVMSDEAFHAAAGTTGSGILNLSIREPAADNQNRGWGRVTPRTGEPAYD
jgi:hypothetical protein